MVTETPSSAKDKKSTLAALDAIEDGPKANEPLMAKLRDHLRGYQPSYDTSEIDMLEKRYTIDLNQPLQSFDVENAKAYSASDSTIPSRMMYAHVCDWGKAQRYRAIKLLKGLDYRSITQVAAAGNVRLSSNNHERYVIFYERPAGIKLSELIKRKKIPANTLFLFEHILSPLANAIQQFSDLDISHGLINPDNIYINDMAVLGPCVAEPCGFSQPFRYESVERIQAMPTAKGEGSTSQDYYALAVVLLEILHGPEYLAHMNQEAFIQSIFRNGAYNTLMQDREVPEVFYDFFRGTLTLNPQERWSGKQVLQWLGGKRFNVLAPPTPVDAVRPYDLGDEKHANTRRELAHMFSHDWERMIASLHNNQLSHWVSVSLRNKELSDIVGRLSRTAYDLSTKNETQTYEALMNIIMLLDPVGPVRIRQLAMHIDGMDSLCADLYFKKMHQELQLLAKFIESNMVNYWIELQSKFQKDKEDYETPAVINALNVRLDRLRSCIRNAGMGFGLERMLYDLNPEMACISPTLASQNVTTLAELLTKLDHLAPTLSENDDPFDRHIAAFIASKLVILKEVRLDELEGLPMLATNKTVMAIYLLGASQIKASHLRLPGLTNWLVLRTLPLMDHIHSRSLRKKYKTALMALAGVGSIPKIADLIVSADYASIDYNGYQQALIDYQENSNSIAFYEAAENVEAESMAMGFRIAKLVAYACLLGSFYFTTVVAR